MRLLFLGDQATTGFGTVTRDLGAALIAQDMDVRFVSQNELSSTLEPPFEGRTVDLVSLPWMLNSRTGQAGVIAPDEALGQVLTGSSDALLDSGLPTKGWVPHAAIVLGDVGAASIFMSQFGKAFKDTPTYHYVPIEGIGLPRAWGELWKTMAPLAMSQFGADEIANVTGVRPPVVYHGVDTDTFRPVSRAKPISFASPPLKLTSKEECKNAWLSWLSQENGNLPRIPRNWLLRTDSHWPRKRYNSMIRALVPVLSRHPDWAMVIHGSPRGPGGNLHHFLSKVPQPVRSQFILTNVWGIPRDALVALYNAADLYLSTSAEGFGLTIAEAIACGVPAVGCDFSAVPEVIGPAGKVVKSYLIDNEYDHYWCAVDEAEFGKTVEYLMTHKAKREELGRKGPAHIRTHFRWDEAARITIQAIRDTLPTEVAA